MKAVILAGGYGTRISEETHLKPKPMIELGGKPILWHILKIFSHYGVNDFVICCGYKANSIKEYFANYFLYSSDVTFDIRNNNMEVHHKKAEPWKVTLVDTGINTMTGGRLKRVREYLDEQDFFFTYGDGVADIDLNMLKDFHKNHGKIATVTAVQPPGRFGALSLEKDFYVDGFKEKPQGDGSWVSGGFFVLNPDVISLIENDATIWEKEPLTILSKRKELKAFFHKGFWHPMDTLRDKNYLEELISRKKASWIKW